ncbi:hypothetical protein GALMADRAFT_148976 [Galerina marginata CBS 339.88]|uniref:Uncharacterized protein n=1 Tax=Galerina marginata (strain CBS 339.88) TaxID=685588 RepID=A0A067SEC3_GALM3|nr:hypothetical protein GALMADRAFT_148976 [Galerina marginata CBS 339.88]
MEVFRDVVDWTLKLGDMGSNFEDLISSSHSFNDLGCLEDCLEAVPNVENGSEAARTELSSQSASPPATPSPVPTQRTSGIQVLNPSSRPPLHSLNPPRNPGSAVFGTVVVTNPKQHHLPPSLQHRDYQALTTDTTRNKEANTSVITNVRDDVRVVGILSTASLLRLATDVSQLVVHGTSVVSHDAWYVDFGGMSGGEAEAEGTRLRTPLGGLGVTAGYGRRFRRHCDYQNTSVLPSVTAHGLAPASLTRVSPPRTSQSVAAAVAYPPLPVTIEDLASPFE